MCNKNLWWSMEFLKIFSIFFFFQFTTSYKYIFKSASYLIDRSSKNVVEERPSIHQTSSSFIVPRATAFFIFYTQLSECEWGWIKNLKFIQNWKPIKNHIYFHFEWFDWASTDDYKIWAEKKIGISINAIKIHFHADIQLLNISLLSHFFINFNSRFFWISFSLD